MKLLLTGKPKSGKTTILKDVMKGVKHTQGFVTEQILKDGQRTGFELVSAGGEHALLASVDLSSNIRVSKYGVDISSIDAFLDSLPAVNSGELIYVDEIGQMELYSTKFKELIGSYMQLPNPLIGTISAVYEDEFTKNIMAKNDVIVLTVEAHNRGAVGDVLVSFMENLCYINSLEDDMKGKVTAMARNYALNENFLQLKKLFRNAIRCVVDGNITSAKSGHYLVLGDHGTHHVDIYGSNYTCDCKLFMGKDEYAGKQGECSHIQAVRLFIA